MKRLKTTIAILLILAIQVLADYSNYTIKDFANIVATQNNINIVIDENLDTNFDFIITKPIKNYTNLDVFAELLDKRGLELQYRDNYYIIIKKDNKMVDKLQIFKTKYIDAQNAVEKISPILSSFYKNIQNDFIEKESKKNNKIKISAKDNNTTNNVKIKKDFSINAVDYNTIVLTYKDDKIRTFTYKILKSIDRLKKQIVIECKVYEVKTEALAQQGVRFEILGDVKKTNLALNVKMAGTLPTVSTLTNQLQVTSIIRLLKNKNFSTLLSTPKATLLEGSKALLKEGFTYPITEEQITTTNSSTTNTSRKVKYIDVGLIFQMEYLREQNKYNYIKLALEKKDILDYDKTQGDLITTTRTLQTDIRALNNQTIIIAGLGRETKIKKTLGIPYLKDLPIIGNIFNYKYDEDKKTTLVITLKVRYDEDKKDLIGKL